MQAESDNLVAAEEFRKDFDRYLAETSQRSEPLAITRNSEVVGVFLSPAQYDALCGTAVRKLLESRAKGPTIAHADVRKQAKFALATKTV